MKYLIMILTILIASSTFALDPTKPVVRIVDDVKVWEHPFLPKSVPWTGDYPYTAASFRWQSDNLYQAVTVTNITVITNAISSELQVVGSTYAQIMQSIFGENAHLNTNITEEYVANTFATAPEITMDTKLALLVLKDKMRTYTSEPLWLFPYGKTFTVITNKAVTFEKE